MNLLDDVKGLWQEHDRSASAMKDLYHLFYGLKHVGAYSRLTDRIEPDMAIWLMSVPAKLLAASINKVGEDAVDFDVPAQNPPDVPLDEKGWDDLALTLAFRESVECMMRATGEWLRLSKEVEEGKELVKSALEGLRQICAVKDEHLAACSWTKRDPMAFLGQWSELYSNKERPAYIWSL